MRPEYLSDENPQQDDYNKLLLTLLIAYVLVVAGAVACVSAVTPRGSDIHGKRSLPNEGQPVSLSVSPEDPE